MDLKKRTECSEILKLSETKCTELLSKCLFTNERNLDMLIRSILLGNPHYKNVTVFISELIREVLLYKPTLSLICTPRCDFMYPETYYKSHPIIVKARKTKGQNYRTSIPNWCIFIKLYNSDYILLSLDHLNHTEMQAIQSLMLKSFTIETTNVNNTFYSFNGFKYNTQFQEYYNVELIISKLLIHIGSLHAAAFSLIDQAVNLIENEVPQIIPIWTKLRPKFTDQN
jgi:hypothetical protein